MDEIVLGTGRVSSIQATSDYNYETGIYTRDFDKTTSTVSFPVSLENMSMSENSASVSLAKLLNYGDEYELVMRKVVKQIPKIPLADGPRMFKEDHEK